MRAPVVEQHVTVSWSLVISAALGIWLTFSPTVFGSKGQAADSNRLVGALIATVAVIVLAEVVRSVRFSSLLFGAWMVVRVPGSFPGLRRG